MATNFPLYTQASSGLAASKIIACETGCVVASDKVAGGIHTTVFTLTDFAVAIANTGASGGSKFATLPEGCVTILSAYTSTLPVITTTSTLSSTINASSVGNYGVGTVVGSAGTLTTTMQNVIPTTAFTSSAVVSTVPAVAATFGMLAAPLNLDGHTTAVPLFFNAGFAESNDIDGDATTTVTAGITLVWVHDGDA